MQTFVLARLDAEEKHTHGVRVATAMQSHPLASATVKALSGDLLDVSGEVGHLLGAKPTARGERSGFVSRKAEWDRNRDQAVSSVDSQLSAWECRFDRPDVQKAVEKLRIELLPTGTGFVRASYTVESSAIKTLLDRADDPKIAAEIERVPELKGFIEHLRSCEQSFLSADSGKEAAHTSATQATGSLGSLERRWVQAARALIAHLEANVDGPQAAMVAELEPLLLPLAEASRTARSRTTRAANSKQPTSTADGQTS